MKVIIFGANGMLGNYLTTYLKTKFTVVPFTRADIDIAEATEEEIFDFVASKVTAKDVIINASGIIKQRSYNVVEMIKVNSLFPHILAKVKGAMGCEVIHITTDCVYNGRYGTYMEDCPHDCEDEYGKTKSLGENENLTLIRTSIIGEEKTSKKSLLEWVISNHGKTIDGYYNHNWNGITCLELTKFIEKVINENLYWLGVKHVYSPQEITKYSLVKLITKIYGLDIKVKKTLAMQDCDRVLMSYSSYRITKSLKDQIIEQKNFKI